MALNRNQEDLIALKVIHAWERVVGSKIPAAERAKLRQFGGIGEGIVRQDGCGERALEARRMRVEGLEFRLAVSQAAQNGCRDEAKRWKELAEMELRRLAAGWDRKGLPVKLSVVPVGPDGMAVGTPDSVSLDRGG